MSVVDTLLAWGRGRAINDPPNDYPRMAAFARLSGRGDVGIAPLSIEEHEYVERVMLDLRERDANRFTVLRLIYVFRLSERQAAKAMKQTRSWVRETRIAAEGWVEAKLD